MPPLIRLIIPLLIGMIGANYVYTLIEWNSPYLLIPFLLLAVLTLYFYHRYKQSSRFSSHFLYSFYGLMIAFGAIITLHSIHDAQEKHGDKWHDFVYRDNPFTFSQAIQIQQFIAQWYENHGLSGQEGAIIQAMTIGTKEKISKEVKDDFAHSGVSHILALSGFHVGIIYMILQIVFLQHIISRRRQWVSQILILLSLWMYAFIAGMSPSLVRAVLMCTILSIGKLNTNETLSLNNLALSALTMLLIHPLLITHVGFQLSYLSMLGIYFIGIPLCKAYTPFCFIDNFLWCTISISISCTLFTLPIVSHTFDSIALLSIPSNIIITLLTYLTFALLPFFIITAGHPFLTKSLMLLAHLMIITTHHIASLPHSSYPFTFSTPAILLYYSVLGIILLMIKAKAPSSLH